MSQTTHPLTRLERTCSKLVTRYESFPGTRAVAMYRYGKPTKYSRLVAMAQERFRREVATCTRPMEWRVAV